MLHTTIRHAVFPAKRRVIVTSDVHGEYDYFQSLLQKLHFSANDILVVNGDIIERGGQSLRCLRFLMQLVKEERAYFICGNNDAFVWRLVHEADMLDTVEPFCRSRASILSEMYREMGLPADMPARDWVPLVRERYKEEFDFLISAPTILETPHFTFVHAGLKDPDIYSSKNSKAFELMKFDDFLSYPISFEKPLVVGHWPTALYSRGFFDFSPYVEENRRIISIDGGCTVKVGGQLNAMVLPDGAGGEYFFQSFDALPHKRALDAQEEKAPSVIFHWPDCRVEYLEKGEHSSLVRHISTGKVLRTFNAKLWENGDRVYCDDYSDGELPVAAGEIVSVVMETPEGSLIKKGGKIGLYYGRLELL